MKRWGLAAAMLLLVSAAGGSIAQASAPRVAFDSNRGGGGTELWTMHADGTGEDRVGSGYQDAFAGDVSPGGGKVAFTRYLNGGTDIFIADTNGGGLKRLTRTGGFLDWNPVFSPDGKRVAYTSSNYTTDDGYLRVQPIDGGKAKKVLHVTLSSEYIYGAAWSPNGKWILLCRGIDEAVMAVHPDGSHYHLLVDQPSGHYLSGIDWAPDGKHFVFAAENGGTDLFVADADGSNVQNITPSGTGSWPQWVLANKILFTSSDDGDTEVYSISSTGSTRQQLTTNSFIDETGFFT